VGPARRSFLLAGRFLTGWPMTDLGMLRALGLRIPLAA
jgi:hypothetical protein